MKTASIIGFRLGLATLHVSAETPGLAALHVSAETSE
jgi:hypothetical protein